MLSSLVVSDWDLVPASWATLALKPSSYHSVTLTLITYDEYDRVNHLIVPLHETQQTALIEEYCFVGA